MTKKGLGRGLSSLMPDTVEDAVAQGDRVLEIPLDKLKANPDQPRKQFTAEQLTELADSIREKGIIQPLVVEALDEEFFCIIAGERRFRAAKQAGVKAVPAVVKKFSEQDKLEIGLIENIQREDLNPIEEAMGYYNLMEKFSLTQDSVAKKLGKSRSAVANALRLLKLPERIRGGIIDKTISAGHARALLSIDDSLADNREALYELICTRCLSVRVAEKMCRMLNEGTPLSRLVSDLDVEDADIGDADVEYSDSDEDSRLLQRELMGMTSGASIVSAEKPFSEIMTFSRRLPEIRDMEESLIKRLGTKVNIKGGSDKGKVEIQYFNSEDLKRLYDLLLND